MNATLSCLTNSLRVIMRREESDASAASASATYLFIERPYLDDGAVEAAIRESREYTSRKTFAFGPVNDWGGAVLAAFFRFVTMACNPSRCFDLGMTEHNLTSLIFFSGFYVALKAFLKSDGPVLDAYKFCDGNQHVAVDFFEYLCNILSRSAWFCHHMGMTTVEKCTCSNCGNAYRGGGGTLDFKITVANEAGAQSEHEFVSVDNAVQGTTTPSTRTFEGDGCPTCNPPGEVKTKTTITSTTSWFLSSIICVDTSPFCAIQGRSSTRLTFTPIATDTVVCAWNDGTKEEYVLTGSVRGNGTRTGHFIADLVFESYGGGEPSLDRCVVNDLFKTSSLSAHDVAKNFQTTLAFYVKKSGDGSLSDDDDGTIEVDVDPRKAIANRRHEEDSLLRNNCDVSTLLPSFLNIPRSYPEVEVALVEQAMSNPSRNNVVRTIGETAVCESTLRDLLKEEHLTPPMLDAVVAICAIASTDLAKRNKQQRRFLNGGTDPETDASMEQLNFVNNRIPLRQKTIVAPPKDFREIQKASDSTSDDLMSALVGRYWSEKYFLADLIAYLHTDDENNNYVYALFPQTKTIAIVDSNNTTEIIAQERADAVLHHVGPFYRAMWTSKAGKTIRNRHFDKAAVDSFLTKRWRVVHVPCQKQDLPTSSGVFAAFNLLSVVLQGHSLLQLCQGDIPRARRSLQHIFAAGKILFSPAIPSSRPAPQQPVLGDLDPLYFGDSIYKEYLRSTVKALGTLATSRNLRFVVVSRRRPHLLGDGDKKYHVLGDINRKEDNAGSILLQAEWLSGAFNCFVLAHSLFKKASAEQGGHKAATGGSAASAAAAASVSLSAQKRKQRPAGESSPPLLETTRYTPKELASAKQSASASVDVSMATSISYVSDRLARVPADERLTFETCTCHTSMYLRGNVTPRSAYITPNCLRPMRDAHAGRGCPICCACETCSNRTFAHLELQNYLKRTLGASYLSEIVTEGIVQYDSLLEDAGVVGTAGEEYKKWIQILKDLIKKNQPAADALSFLASTIPYWEVAHNALFTETSDSDSESRSEGGASGSEGGGPGYGDADVIDAFLNDSVPFNAVNLGSCYAEGFVAQPYHVSLRSDDCSKCMVLARGLHYESGCIAADDFRLKSTNAALVRVVHLHGARIAVPSNPELEMLPDSCLFFCSCEEEKMLFVQDHLKAFRNNMDKATRLTLPPAEYAARCNDLVNLLREEVSPFGDFSCNFCMHTSIVHQYASVFRRRVLDGAATRLSDGEHIFQRALLRVNNIAMEAPKFVVREKIDIQSLVAARTEADDETAIPSSVPLVLSPLRNDSDMACECPECEAPEAAHAERVPHDDDESSAAGAKLAFPVEGLASLVMRNGTTVLVFAVAHTNKLLCTEHCNFSGCPHLRIVRNHERAQTDVHKEEAEGLDEAASNAQFPVISTRPRFIYISNLPSSKSLPLSSDASEAAPLVMRSPFIPVDNTLRCNADVGCDCDAYLLDLELIDSMDVTKEAHTCTEKHVCPICHGDAFDSSLHDGYYYHGDLPLKIKVEELTCAKVGCGGKVFYEGRRNHVFVMLYERKKGAKSYVVFSEYFCNLWHNLLPTSSAKTFHDMAVHACCRHPLESQPPPELRSRAFFATAFKTFHSFVKFGASPYCRHPACLEHPQTLILDGCRNGDRASNKESLREPITVDRVGFEGAAGMVYSEKAYLRVALSLQNELLDFCCKRKELTEAAFDDLMDRLRAAPIPRDAGCSPTMRRYFQDECRLRNAALAQLVQAAVWIKEGVRYIPHAAKDFFSAILARGVCCFVHFTAPVMARCIRRVFDAIDAIEEPESQVEFLEDLRGLVGEGTSVRTEPLPSLEEFRYSTLLPEDADPRTARKKQLSDLLTILPCLKPFFISCVLRIPAIQPFTVMNAVQPFTRLQECLPLLMHGERMARHAANKIKAFGQIAIHTDSLGIAEGAENIHFVTTTREEAVALGTGSVDSMRCINAYTDSARPPYKINKSNACKRDGKGEGAAEYNFETITACCMHGVPYAYVRSWQGPESPRRIYQLLRDKITWALQFLCYGTFCSAPHVHTSPTS